eukprot:6813872-Prymnesium_polylepis.1
MTTLRPRTADPQAQCEQVSRHHARLLSRTPPAVPWHLKVCGDRHVASLFGLMTPKPVGRQMRRG